MELAKLKSDYFELVAKMEQKPKEEDTPNYEYVKNVLVSYMMTVDVGLQVNLLRVIFVAMKFTEQEQAKVKEAFNANHTSYLSKMTGAKLI